MIIDQAPTYCEQIVALLAAEKLRVADLPETLDNFIVTIQDATVMGVEGVEVSSWLAW